MIGDNRKPFFIMKSSTPQNTTFSGRTQGLRNAFAQVHTGAIERPAEPADFTGRDRAKGTAERLSAWRTSSCEIPQWRKLQAPVPAISFYPSESSAIRAQSSS